MDMYTLHTHTPLKARYVVDLGAGDGDGAAATARRLPDASVVAVECSPTMIVVGRIQNTVSNLSFLHALAEDTEISASVTNFYQQSFYFSTWSSQFTFDHQIYP
jgi:trans-aconitate methyltransferase